MAEEFLMPDQDHPVSVRGEAGRPRADHAFSVLYCGRLQALAPLPLLRDCSELPSLPYFQGEKPPAMELSPLETLKLN